MELRRPLSHTQMRMYETCPQKWKLKYVDGHEEEPKWYFNLGSAVHDALEACYRKRVAGPAPLEEMEEAFEATFDADAYDSPEQAERYRADGLAMVRAFRERADEGFRPPLLVEHGFRTVVAGEPVVARIDRVDRLDGDDGESRLRIVDYKTGRAFTLSDVEENEQLTLYQMVAEEELGVEVGSLVLYHVPSQTPFEVGRRGDERIRSARDRIVRVARGIRSERFEPNPGDHCRWCDFQPWCPAFADEYPENWQQEPAPPAPSHDEAAELADRYGELKNRLSEEKSELSRVRDRLERFFAETDERAVSGDRYRVSATRRTGWRFDDDELRELLEPLGLWEKVLGPDWRRQTDLPEDPEVSDDVRERLREIGREKVTWRLRSREREPEPES